MALTDDSSRQTKHSDSFHQAVDFHLTSRKSVKKFSDLCSLDTNTRVIQTNLISFINFYHWLCHVLYMIMADIPSFRQQKRLFPEALHLTLCTREAAACEHHAPVGNVATCHPSWLHHDLHNTCLATQHKPSRLIPS